MGGHLLGWRTVCAVEFAAYPRSVLLARQRDGMLPRFPIWDDVRTFDGNPWRGRVDVVSGGFPCTDISSAGRGAGINGKRSGLWVEMARIISEVRPSFVFVENSPMLTLRGLGTVLGDLAKMGFDAEWGVVGGNHIGAATKRERIWIMAYANAQSERFKLHDENGIKVEWDCTTGQFELCCSESGISSGATHPGWATEPDVGRVAHGVADRVDRLRAAGNGQIPGVAAAAWRILTHNTRIHRAAEGRPVE